MYLVEIIKEENLDDIIPYLQLLNPKTGKDILIQRLNEIRKSGYQCVGVYFESRLIAVSGIWILNKFYAGKHIEPDNVIVHPDFRNKGIGELLMDWIHEYAKEIGCLTSELNCRVTNASGNRFWMNQGYEIAGYHYIKRLTEEKTSVNSCVAETGEKCCN